MRKEYVDSIRIRTNPHYDHSVPPEENEFEFWNPVSANNDLLKLANAALDITQQCTLAIRRRATVRAELREIRWKKESLERKLLAEDPLKPAESKTLKTVSAAILARAWKDADKLATIEQLENQEEGLEKQMETLTQRIDEWQTWLKTVEQMSDNIKTALSFYKDERRRA